jgi:hypothetical protein
VQGGDSEEGAGPKLVIGMGALGWVAKQRISDTVVAKKFGHCCCAIEYLRIKAKLVDGYTVFEYTAILVNCDISQRGSSHSQRGCFLLMRCRLAMGMCEKSSCNLLLFSLNKG